MKYTKFCLGITALAFFCGWSFLSAQTPDLSPVAAELFQPREGVPYFVRKLETGEPVNIAYFGGSITAADGWRVQTFDWFRQEFPNVKISEINAAIGGTGSDLGAFRCEYDVLRYQPDLVFVEFAVNDSGASPESVARSMEGIVRQIRRQNIKTDIIFVYTYEAGFEKDIENGYLPRSASVMEHLAQWYGIAAVNFMLPVVEQEKAGKLVYKSEGPADGKLVFSHDGVHPTAEGHRIYTDQVIRAFAFFRQNQPNDAELASILASRNEKLTTPFIEGNLESAKMADISESMLTGNWSCLPPDDNLYGFHNRLGENIWTSQTPGDTMTFQLKGTRCEIYDLLGPNAGQITITVDGKTSNPIPRFDSYCTYWRLATLPAASGLDPSQTHTISITIHQNEPDRHPVAFRLENPEEELAQPKYHGHNVWFGRILYVGDSVSAASAP